MDGWLLQRFPGKTLEELDDMNWPRLMRALRAATVDRLEQMLPLYYAGKWEPTDDEWEIIQQNNALADD